MQRLAQERRPAGEHLVEDGAQGVDVRGRPDFAHRAAGLLGGHVARRAEDGARRRMRSRAPRRVERLARPKSVTLGVPSASSRTLAGLRSRCRMPF